MSTQAAQLARRGSVHRRGAVVVSLLVCAGAAWIPTPPLELQMLILGASVALVGFPHGALDPLVAAIDVPRRGHGWMMRFAAAYVALAALTVALWVLHPGLGLALFLITSAVHFGLGDVPGASPESSGFPRAAQAGRVAAHGSAPILLPAAFHPEEVSVVFGWLMGAEASDVAAWMVDGRAWLVSAWAVTLFVGYASPSTGWRRRVGLVELGVLALAYAVLPPLLSFTLYFCGWHSLRHLLAVDTALGSTYRLRSAVVGLAVLAVTALLMAAAQLLAAEPASLEASARTLFVALAALTPPHMVVTAKLPR